MAITCRWQICAILKLAFVATAAPIADAHAQKKPLTPADWDRWRTIQGSTLSNDGKWVAYTLSPSGLTMTEWVPASPKSWPPSCSTST